MFDFFGGVGLVGWLDLMCTRKRRKEVGCGGKYGSGDHMASLDQSWLVMSSSCHHEVRGCQHWRRRWRHCPALFVKYIFIFSHLFSFFCLCETEIWDLTYSCGHIAFNYSSSRHLLTLFRSSNKKSFSKPSYKVSKLFTSTESQSSMHDFYSIIRKITNFIIF